MTFTSTLKELVAHVRVYADPDAFRRDEFGRAEYLEMKPQHDELYQAAISYKLATVLVAMQRRRPSPGIQSIFKVAKTKPKWHPANFSPSKLDLLMAPVTAFEHSWSGIKRLAVESPKGFSLWHDDPALIFEPLPSVFLCRTACVGHEGQVLYFAYRKEREWTSLLERSSLTFLGEGEDVYKTIVRVPGKFTE